MMQRLLCAAWCHACSDILVPLLGNDMNAPFYEMPWQHKTDAAAWRGSSFHSLRWPLLGRMPRSASTRVDDDDGGAARWVPFGTAAKRRHALRGQRSKWWLGATTTRGR
jgi:hypothetical protein